MPLNDAAVMDDENIYLYIDGVLDASETKKGDIYLGRSTESLEIGYERSVSNYFHGSIDEVRIYNRALSESEIRVLYNGYK